MVEPRKRLALLTATLKVRVSPAQKAALEAEADRRGCNVSDLVRELAERLVKEADRAMEPRLDPF